MPILNTMAHAEITIHATFATDGATIWRATAAMPGSPAQHLASEGCGMTREIAIAESLIRLGAEMLKTAAERER